MNEQQAIESGYTFQGGYGWDKDEIKAKAAKLRAEGNKAIVVYIPPDKLSRGHRGMGYSVYWIKSTENIAVREAAEKQSTINRLITERQNLLNKAEELTEDLSELGYDVFASQACDQQCCT